MGKVSGIMRNSFTHHMYTGVTDAIHEAQYVTHALAHSLDAPLSGVWTEAKTIAHCSWNFTNVVFRLATFYAGGWLAWTCFSDSFPRQKRMLTEAMGMTNKRRRY